MLNVSSGALYKVIRSIHTQKGTIQIGEIFLYLGPHKKLNGYYLFLNKKLKTLAMGSKAMSNFLEEIKTDNE